MSAATLEANLGLAAGTLSSLANGTAVNGSALTMPSTFAAQAGDQVSFTANFLTSEDPLGSGNDDYAFAVINGPNGQTFQKLTDVTQATLNSSLLNSLSTGFYNETGPTTVNLTLPAAGDLFDQSGRCQRRRWIRPIRLAARQPVDSRPVKLI